MTGKDFQLGKLIQGGNFSDEIKSTGNVKQIPQFLNALQTLDVLKRSLQILHTEAFGLGDVAV